jgi:hypothetical protein
MYLYVSSTKIMCAERTRTYDVRYVSGGGGAAAAGGATGANLGSPAEGCCGGADHGAGARELLAVASPRLLKEKDNICGK